MLYLPIINEFNISCGLKDKIHIIKENECIGLVLMNVFEIIEFRISAAFLWVERYMFKKLLRI